MTAHAELWPPSASLKLLEVVGGPESLDGVSKTEISRAVVLETFDVSFEELEASGVHEYCYFHT